MRANYELIPIIKFIYIYTLNNGDKKRCTKSK